MDATGLEHTVGRLFLAGMENGYRGQKALAERALAQLDDADWHRTLDAGGNSIAVIVRHVAGNLRSRWRDFLTSDGEKPDRRRDDEFEPGGQAVSAMLEEWQAGFDEVLETLARLTPADLTRTVTIRGKALGVVDAILRNYDHTGHHVGQVVFLAKHWRGDAWQTLSIPRKGKG
ncbi:MAG: DUF1572 family protein [Trueperaceae bacterium]|nr:DUF1572 family protein [Trueperaceae bacterium]